MNALYNMFKVTLLSFILALTISTSKAQHDLARDTAIMLKQYRHYTDTRTTESQVKTFTVVSDISKATRLLALIICQRENDRPLCSENLHTQGETRQ